jgi:1,4-alpha-glucan branching enzyme
MKKLSTLFFVIVCNFLIAQTYPITFQVDMNNVIGFSVANVNGTFNNWCGGCAAMTDANGDNVWEITINLAPGNYEYKFTADGWNQQENLSPGSACTVTNFGYTNRSLIVGSAAQTLPVVCWGACASCTTVTPVTFSVDMSNVTQAYTQVQLAGSFNGWAPATTPMTDSNGDDIWEVTINLAAGDYEYKFAADNWAIQENLMQGSVCTATNFGYTNRTITVGSAAQNQPTVCWGACEACSNVSPYYDITFQVNMNEVTGFTTPELNGTFNGWCGNCTAMSDANADGVWEVTIPLQAGSYEYKYAFDNWTGSEQLTAGDPCTVTDGAFTNRLLIVEGTTTLAIVCYGSCSNCANAPVMGCTDPAANNYNASATMDDGSCQYDIFGCTDPMASNYNASATNDDGSCQYSTAGCTDVAASNYNPSATADDGSCLFATTFEVDMTCAGAFTTVHVTGPWCGWCGAETYNTLSDNNADGIFDIVVELPAGTVEYKYMVDNWASQENLVDDMLAGGTCAPITDLANYANRTMAAGATSSDVYGRCDACQVGNTYNVTFQVDMNQQTGFTLPEVNGNFNGWCGNCNPMTDTNGDNIWEATIALAPGTYEFKFAADAWTISESLIPGSACTVTNFGFTNRTLVVGDSDMVLPVVCWGFCEACEVAPEIYNVTFVVDMNNTVGFTTPEVNGTFNGWCGSCNPMSDANGDNVWETTIAIPAGAHEFKFSADAWGISEDLATTLPCVITNGQYTNRVLNLSDNTVMDTVCWGTCTNCMPPVTYNVHFEVDLGGLSADRVEIVGNFNGFCMSCDTLQPLFVNNTYGIDLQLEAGLYDYFFTINEGQDNEVLTDDVCTMSLGGNFHRVVTVTADTFVPSVCWESCSPCVVGVDEMESLTFEVYPNPAHQSLQLPSVLNGATMTIYNAQGQLVKSGVNFSNTVDIQALAVGLYHIILQKEQRTWNSAFIKE